MFKDINKEEKKNEDGMFVNTFVCVDSVTTVTRYPYNLDRPLCGKLLVERDDDNNETGFRFVESVTKPKTRNENVHKSPHFSLLITDAGDFNGTMHFAKGSQDTKTLKKEFEQVLKSLENANAKREAGTDKKGRKKARLKKLMEGADVPPTQEKGNAA